MTFRKTIRNWIRSNGILYALLGWKMRHRIRCFFADLMLRLIRGTVRWFVVLPMNVVSKVFSVECFICDNLGSIGHLVLEVARPIVMYASFSRKKHIVFVGDKSKAANAYLLSLWESRYPFLNAAGTTLERLSLFSKVYQPRLVQYWYDNHRHIDHVITMFNGPPPIELPEDDVARGYRLLERLGVSKSEWFVCAHAREGGFKPHLTYHSYRDTDIHTFIPAFEYITARGGKVIRIGDATMKALPSSSGVIDYAHSPMKSDFMDIFLLSRCRFLIGCNSGISNVAWLFLRPAVYVNVIPLGDCGAANVFIPKLLYSKRLARCLTIPELFELGCLDFYRTEQYERAGLEPVCNDPQDILDAVAELMCGLDGDVSFTAEDELRQDYFRRLLRAQGFPPWKRTRMSRNFTRKYGDLIAPGVGTNDMAHAGNEGVHEHGLHGSHKERS